MSVRHVSAALSTVALLAVTAACGGTGTAATTTSAAAAGSTSTHAAAAGATAPESPKYTDEPASGAANLACGTLTQADPAAAAKLPAGFPTVDHFVPTFSGAEGATVLVRGAVPGTPPQIPAIRDAGFAKIKAAGYTVTGQDQEIGFEADGDFTGPHPGNINVKTLCQGYLVVTYTLTS